MDKVTKIKSEDSEKQQEESSCSNEKARRLSEKGSSYSLSEEESSSKNPSQSQQKTASGGATGATGATKRRPHSKSRRGCQTCKKRRVKCDETHPMCKNCEHLGLECSFTIQAQQKQEKELQLQSARALNMMDLRLFYHYTTKVWKTITAAGILDDQIWGTEVPMLSFDYPFLMHAILTFSATHLARTHRGIPESVITVHRGDALKLLREEVRQVNARNLDALVAASILLILDSLANASLPNENKLGSLPASAWLHHVRGAATILISVQPLPPESRFYELVNIDLSDLADVQPVTDGMQLVGMSGLECFDDELKSLYPVHTSSPYFQTLVYLDKLYHQRHRADFILRVFSFPALLDKNLIYLLVQGDEMARKIIKTYYKIVRNFTQHKKQSVWFLEGVAQVLPIDSDSEFGGLGFITSALPLAGANANAAAAAAAAAAASASASSSASPSSLAGLAGLTGGSFDQSGLEKILEGFDAGIIAGMNEAGSLPDFDKFEPTGLTEL